MLCSRRQKARDIKPEEKWDFIVSLPSHPSRDTRLLTPTQSLQDFKSSSFFEYLAYAYLWFSLLISVAVYGVDTFTAYNLLALNKFTGIKPPVSLSVSKWIFTGCIIASWVNVVYEHIRAWRIMRRGAVAESYLDSLAVRLQAIRIFGRARGWKRFLVFSELTTSKKGAEYVALFTYFSFQSWIRVIFCSGPRQVINALTLRELYVAKLDPAEPDAATSILKFFENFGILAKQDREQAVVLSGMLFTLIIWVFAALSLLLAMAFYLLFLWHYIPNGDGGLSGYCERKINGRLREIVSVKVNKAIQEEERKRVKADQKAFKNGEKPTLGRQATLPTLFDTKSTDKLPAMPMLNRNDTTATLPPYTSRPGTPSNQQPRLPDLELSNLDQKRPMGPSRLGTSSSAISSASYASNAPLMAAAADMGYARAASPAPSLPHLDTNQPAFPFPGPQRTMTGSTNGSQWPRNPQQMRNGPPGPSRQDSFANGAPGPSRQPTQNSFSNGPPGPSRQMTQDSFSNGAQPPLRNMTPLDRTMGNTPLDRTMNNTPLDRTMNMTPMERTMSPAPYASLPPRNPPYPSSAQDAYGPHPVIRSGPSRQMTADSYGVSPVEEPTLPNFDAAQEPTVPNLDAAQGRGAQVGQEGYGYAGRAASYAASVASNGSAGTAGGSGNGSGNGNPYRPPPRRMDGRGTPSQGSIDASMGRAGTASPAAGQAYQAYQPYQPYQQQRGYASGQGQGQEPTPRSASAQPMMQGQGQGMPGGFRPPMRNMTAPVEGYFGDAQAQGQGQRSGTPGVGAGVRGPVGGGYDAYGGGGEGDRDVERGYRM